MLVARKTLSVGPFVVNDGDVVSDEIQNMLPANRRRQLIDNGSFKDVTDNDVLYAEIEALKKRVAALERRKANNGT